jgi:hypothetical protein
VVHKYKISIITTVSNRLLFEKSRVFLPTECDHFYIDGRFGFYGLKAIELALTCAQLKPYEWIIFLDEDAVILDAKKLYSVIQHMFDENFGIAGVRDGGEIEFRRGNPHFPNLSFLIINKNALPKEIDFSVKLRQEFFTNPNNFNTEFPFRNGYEIFQNSEEYYNFFQELLIKNISFLFLKSRFYSPSTDDFTTVFFDHEGKDLIIHTWWARAYGQNERHTNRINRIFDNLPLIKSSYHGQEISNPEYFLFLFKSKKKRLKKLIKKLLFIEY